MLAQILERVCFGKRSSWGESIAAELLSSVFCSCCCITLYMSEYMNICATVRAFAEILAILLRQGSEQAEWEKDRECCSLLDVHNLRRSEGTTHAKSRILPQLNSQSLFNVSSNESTLYSYSERPVVQSTAFSLFIATCTVDKNDNTLKWYRLSVLG